MSRSRTAIVAPCSAKILAIAAPIPLPPPVMTATLFANIFIRVSFLSDRKSECGQGRLARPTDGEPAVYDKLLTRHISRVAAREEANCAGGFIHKIGRASCRERVDG